MVQTIRPYSVISPLKKPAPKAETSRQQAQTLSFKGDLTAEEKEKQIQKEMDAVTAKFFIYGCAGILGMFMGIAGLWTLSDALCGSKEEVVQPQQPQITEVQPK